KNSGYKSYKDAAGNDVEHWTCDHQPPRSTYNSKTAASSPEAGGAAGIINSANTTNQHGDQVNKAVRLYPHCKTCSNSQGRALSAMANSGNRAQMANMGMNQLASNSGISV